MLQSFARLIALIFFEMSLSCARAALLLRSTSSVASNAHSIAVGTGRSSATPFGGTCEEDKECVSGNCYSGKCGYSGNCRKRGELCHTYAAHTCCAGTCQAVAMIDDCKRLLSGSPSLQPGFSLARQCQHLGVCQSFPGANEGPGRLSTPWAVPANDMARKYFTRAGLTFAEGVAVRTDLFVARRPGQTYLNIAPDSVKPGALRDAGVVMFTDDSKVAVEMGMRFSDGRNDFCAAPILRDGVGGGFYAVGQGCCNQNGKFTCDDAAKEIAGHHVTSGLVVASDHEKYMQAVLMIDGVHGYKFHDDKKGIKTPLPMFVRILKEYAKEFDAPHVGFTYVAPAKITYCVAPVMASGSPDKTDVEFWAAGTDCCSMKGGFHCGEVDTLDARSGKQVKDSTGMYRMAVTMAELRYGLQAPASPLYVKWTAATLVPTPP